mgnify:CR=1 FL=1
MNCSLFILSWSGFICITYRCQACLLSTLNLGRSIEDILERSMFASRWLMAPVYVVLSLSLAFIMIKVIQIFFHEIIYYDPATQGWIFFQFFKFFFAALKTPFSTINLLPIASIESGKKIISRELVLEAIYSICPLPKSP